MRAAEASMTARASAIGIAKQASDFETPASCGDTPHQGIPAILVLTSLAYVLAYGYPSRSVGSWMATNSVLDDPEFRQKMKQAYAIELQLVERLRGELSLAEQRLEALNQLQGTVVDPAPVARTSTPRPVTLSGDSLRAEAHRILREVDPSQRGVHPRKIADLIQREGYRISGRADDKTANVRSTIGYGSKSAPLFRAVANGLYTWK
jgi:hypothetical protein